MALAIKGSPIAPSCGDQAVLQIQADGRLWFCSESETGIVERLRSMNLTFKNDWLEQLALGIPVKTRFSAEIIQRYRERIQTIIDAVDERDLRMIRGANFEKLKNELKGQYSMRLNKQFRIVFEIHPGMAGNTIHITDLADYH